jgi:hypothetical protein
MALEDDVEDATEDDVRDARHLRDRFHMVPGRDAS